MVNFDYLYNPKAAKPHLEKNYFIDKKLGFQVIEQGTILPHKGGAGILGLGGIVDREKKFVPSTYTIELFDGAYTPPPRINSTQLRDRNISWHDVQYLGAYYHR